RLRVDRQGGALGDRRQPGGDARGGRGARGARVLAHPAMVARPAGAVPGPPVPRTEGRDERHGQAYSTKRPRTRTLDPWWLSTTGSTARCDGRSEAEVAKGSGAIGSAPVSKTGGCGFESLLPCSSGVGTAPSATTP